MWEVAIKRSLGKLDAPGDFAPTLLGAGAHPLPISLDHAAAVELLPWHHRDPFDRLLVAQAMIERAAAGVGRRSAPGLRHPGRLVRKQAGDEPFGLGPLDGPAASPIQAREVINDR